MKKEFTTKLIAEIAIFAAAAIALDFLSSGIWRFAFVNGGSVNLAVIPLIIITYRRGFLSGLICSIIVAFAQFLGGFYAIADTWYNVFFQIMLDYVVAFPLVAIGAGIFAKSFRSSNDLKKQTTLLILGSVIGTTLKFVSHFLSGVIFWSDSISWNAFNGMPILYSFVYNGAYCIPTIIIATIIVTIIFKKQPSFFNVNIVEGDINNEQKN